MPRSLKHGKGVRQPCRAAIVNCCDVRRKSEPRDCVAYVRKAAKERNPERMEAPHGQSECESRRNHFDPIPRKYVIGVMMFVRERVDGIILEVVRVGELIHINAVHPESGRVIHTTELSDQEAELLAADLRAVIDKRVEQASGRTNRQDW